MAARDKYGLFSEDKAFQTDASTAYSTNEVDLGTGKDAFGSTLANPNIGQGKPIWLNITIGATLVATGGSPTITFNLVGGTATSPTTIVQILTGAIAMATLVEGYKMSFPLQSYPALPRFLRLQVVTASNGMSAGTYTAWLDSAPVGDV